MNVRVRKRHNPYDEYSNSDEEMLADVIEGVKKSEKNYDRLLNVLVKPQAGNHQIDLMASLSDVSDIETIKRSRAITAQRSKSREPEVTSPAAKIDLQGSIRESINCSPILQALRSSNRPQKYEILKEIDQKIVDFERDKKQ